MAVTDRGTRLPHEVPAPHATHFLGAGPRKKKLVRFFRREQVKEMPRNRGVVGKELAKKMAPPCQC